jgi:hypothetical protein
MSDSSLSNAPADGRTKRMDGQLVLCLVNNITLLHSFFFFSWEVPTAGRCVHG